MIYQIGECSPAAKSRIVSMDDKVGTSEETTARTKYPFGQLYIGQAFVVPFNDSTENNVRRCATMYGRLLAKTFTVIKHAEHNCYEVARIA